MQNRKILYFDYWTVGIHNFKLFDHQLKEHGFEVKLLHLGSWREPGTLAYENIDGIDCYDISYYKTKFLFRILKDEAPKAVITLNSSFTMDRAMTLICKTLGIKLIYLMHGIMTREEYVEDSIRTGNQMRKKNIIGKAINQLKGIVPNYLYSLYKYDKKYLFTLYPYALLVKTLFNPTYYLNFPPPSFDLNPDLSLVYGNVDKRFYGKCFTDKRSEIKVVGNPNLDSYFRQLKHLPDGKEAFLNEHNIPGDKPYVTYLEEGFVGDKFWDSDYHLSFCKTLIEACHESGCHLVIKLHPRTATSQYMNDLKMLQNVTLIVNINVPKLIYFTEKCICHYSTTLIYPMLLGKPILLPRWGRSADLMTLYNEKEVTFVNSIELLRGYLKKSDFNYDRSQYLEDYVPFTDGRTADRIVHAIMDVISR